MPEKPGAPNIAFVLPCYNEEAVLPITAKRLLEKRAALIAEGTISHQSRLVFVNDGSSDGTWRQIAALFEAHPEAVEGISLSRNRGHQNALLAGLMTVRTTCDAAISMDADLQDDIDAADEMLRKFSEGYDVVYGVRDDRAADSWFKKTTAQGFYRMMNAMGVELVYNHADYRLMSRRALEGLSEFREVNLFLRGVVPLIGYPAAKVFYKRGTRAAGESKYPLKKMIAFAMEGVTSLSVKPIRLITALGVGIFGVSLLVLLYCLVRHLTGHTVTGWTSTAMSVWCIGGLQLLAIGVIGEYIGKIYLETKGRPSFLIAEHLRKEQETNREER